MTLTAGESKENVSSEELTLWRMLQRAQVRIARVLETDLLVEHDLPLASYEVLLQLSEVPERRLRMNDLADRVLLSRSGLTRLIDRLQRDGLVEREACTSDARGLFAVLTDAGAARLAEAGPTYLRGVRAQFLGMLDTDELRQCAAVLNRLLPTSGTDPC
ncbi:MarR family transcriptional regulator [Streptosporangium sp. NBC_01755]|uniref:MarR family winged helix-turn-helix transcriptional regulator n=1 Tax=unclassified Streptosporangium TaxID=2632669 RepID=UPI002DDB4A67|nr:MULTISPECIES: MarR family transcriptional regulator [unclassified Streptosporangium]WSA26251.1 MarR family transcriptional regulator [Streptosporangium sp. NBC_01810]WSD02321.1 MarR family transcriptional regulator [Streptosporangium sp. NBC_01755]